MVQLTHGVEAVAMRRSWMVKTALSVGALLLAAPFAVMQEVGVPLAPRGSNSYLDESSTNVIATTAQASFTTPWLAAPHLHRASRGQWVLPQTDDGGDLIFPKMYLVSECMVARASCGAAATSSGSQPLDPTAPVTLICNGSVDNSTTVSNALTADQNIKFTMAGGTNCVMNTPQTVPSTVKSLDFTGVNISGTPSTDSPLFTVSSPITVTGGTFANNHSAGNPYWQFSIFNVLPGADGSVFQDLTGTAGRGLIHISGPSVGLVNDIQIIHPVCTGMTDFCVSGGGNKIVIDGAVISGTVTSGYLGPPHDINLEDCTNCTISNPVITDGNGMTESGASCIQVYPNHANVNGTKILDPICTKTGGATYPAIFAWTKPGDIVTVDGGTLTGYSMGVNSRSIQVSSDVQPGIAKVRGVTVVPGAVPVWNAAYTYNKNDLVVYMGTYYHSLQTNNTNHPPNSSPSFWASGPSR